MIRHWLSLRAAGVRLTAASRDRVVLPRRHSTATSAAGLPPWPPGDDDAHRDDINGNDAADAAAPSSSSSSAPPPPLLRAASLPPPYYTHPSAVELDLSRVFQPSWLYAGPAAWVENAGDYMTIQGGGALPRAVVVRGPDGALKAFHNVCRHRAAPVADRPRGNAKEKGAQTGCEMAFVCGYHGWTYGPDGRLLRAPRMGGAERLSPRRLSLAPLDACAVGPLVFVHRRPREGEAAGNKEQGAAAAAAAEGAAGLDAWLGPKGAAAVRAVVSGSYGDAKGGGGGGDATDAPAGPGGFVHVARREWRVRCDWKVYADNFLDGGYHVPCAHAGLAAGLDLGTYASREHGPRVSVQSVLSSSSSSSSAAAAGAAAGREVGGDDDDDDDDAGASSSRLGRRAAYAWVFPNVALNRYGPWLDVNAVAPDPDAGPGRCVVTFDWFLQRGAPGAEAAAAAARFSSSFDVPSALGGPLPPFDEQLRRLPPAVAGALRSSCAVQEEDVALCEGVQRGLDEHAASRRRGGGAVYGSPSVGFAAGGEGEPLGGGRYARQEAPMFHFHRALWAAYTNNR